MSGGNNAPAGSVWIDSPTSSGWWWFRWKGGDRIEAVEVQLDEGFERFYSTGNDDYSVLEDYRDSKWQAIIPAGLTEVDDRGANKLSLSWFDS